MPTRTHAEVFDKRALRPARPADRLAQSLQYGVVDEPVRADDRLARPRRAAVPCADPPAGLLDEHRERGVVVQRERRVDRRVERALGDEDVLPEIADAARVPDVRLERGEVAGERARRRRGVEARDRRDPDRACRPRTRPRRAPPTSAARAPAPRRRRRSAPRRARARSASPRRGCRARSSVSRRSGRGSSGRRPRRRPPPRRARPRPGARRRSARAGRARPPGRRRSPASGRASSPHAGRPHGSAAARSSRRRLRARGRK